MNKSYSGLRSNPVNQRDNYSNYESLVYTFSGNVIDKINKKDSLYKIPTAKENLIYTGEAQALLNAGSTNDGTIKYSLDGTNWSTSIPTGTEAQTYIVYWKLEGDANHNDVAQTTISVEITSVTPSHDYVEIGGIKWATMNVGANSVTDTGLYFQWGDTQGYTNTQVGNGEGQKSFGSNDCIYYNDDSYTKYNETDGLTTLESSDDAVTAAWGGNWRMPTVSEFIALCEAVNITWTDDYQGSGIAGLICTDKTDETKSLFFPACGNACNDGVWATDNRCYYWSSSLNAECECNNAMCLEVNSDSYDIEISNYDRYTGYPVRGILDE